MKTILCAVDYSENAVTALKFAYTLSTKIDASLFVIHIFDLPTLSSDLDDPYFLSEGAVLEKRNSKLKEFCIRNLNCDLNKMNVKTEAIEDNSVVNGIISKAVELSAYIIVAGMKGENILNLIMGSTTQQLLEKAPCPIFAIPNNMTLKQIKTIVYASDFEEEDIAAINKLTEIIKPFKSKIKVVHISAKNEYDAKLLMEWFKELLKQKVKYKEIAFEVMSSEDVFNSLKTYLKDSDANMVAMMERKKTGFIKKILHRDLVKRMESFGEIPLISFNEANY